MRTRYRSRPISQRAARALKKRVEELERKQHAFVDRWARNPYPGGVHIDTIKVTNAEACIIATAFKLGHAVVLREASDDQMYVYAVKP